MDYQSKSDDIRALSDFHAKYNLAMIESQRKYLLKKEEISATTENDKVISAAKAEVLADATKEAYDYRVARAHVENLNVYIKSIEILAR